MWGRPAVNYCKKDDLGTRTLIHGVSSARGDIYRIVIQIAERIISSSSRPHINTSGLTLLSLLLLQYQTRRPLPAIPAKSVISLAKKVARTNDE